ncbi:helix-turn-helix domain-containing protein [Dellaglioa algida]|uniref:helix-turn-helix domain-containing protein n=2 Tax=Dellaglioa algida TaxID=105612 RepID=UPI0024C4D69E|nr:helix-turn-helix transcriptional regulator [Dellaglioa algida]MDK1716376.1 helix-turn-helix domain-containing protein [Dellaglioa algida]MDK1720270.1 helix-turn-helix domain-containing protein [Dellaglioa algida]MDK1721317.1 helix-turn-helix domain-containing protein [Dellaglioa algida]
MTLFDRIKTLSNKKYKNVKEVATELGFSENLFYKWKTSEPKARDVQKVADYFNVSTDYLLGRTDVMNISPQEQEQQDMKDMLQDNRILSFDGKPIPEKDKEQILDFIEFLKNKNGRDNE